ncbi:hypothetical protein BAU15_10300 [Enterococcus sp. JM4C]|nr:hypothetical protein BAU15_10300 [Enterococcus sp. JM4C]
MLNGKFLIPIDTIKLRILQNCLENVKEKSSRKTTKLLGKNWRHWKDNSKVIIANDRAENKVEKILHPVSIKVIF